MKEPIRLGHIALSFHAASAAVVQRILARHGYQVVVHAAPHEEIFQLYGAGRIDMLVSAWLDASHGKYLAPYHDQTRKLGVLYHPYCIWGVPEYVPEDAVGSVADLARPEVVDRMSKLVQGINPGAGISRFSKEIIRHYDLGALGYHFESGSEADCFGRFESSVKKREWFVIPLWHPQFLHHQHKIRALVEPKGLLGGQDRATLVAHHDCVQKMDAALVEDLSRLELGNALVSELDYQISRSGMSASQVADYWCDKVCG